MSDIDPGDGYRLLGYGDIIKRGDEFFLSAHGWQLARNDLIGVNLWWGTPYRRRTDAPTGDAPTGDATAGDAFAFARNIALEAIDIVTGDRRKAYGLPTVTHSRSARVYEAITGASLGETDTEKAESVCLINIAQKLSRQANRSERDNLVDIIGYVMNLAIVIHGKDER